LREAESDRFFGPDFYISGDDVAYDAGNTSDPLFLGGGWKNDTVSGTLNGTIRLDAFLPPSASLAAFPAPAVSPFGRALLVAAILGGERVRLIGVDTPETVRSSAGDRD